MTLTRKAGRPRIAITGATGFVGQALMDLALEQGMVVDALTRSSQPRRNGVSWIRGDLADRDALDELMLGAEVAIHVAGVVNAPDPGEFEAANVTGTLAVLEAASRPGRLLAAGWLGRARLIDNVPVAASR